MKYDLIFGCNITVCGKIFTLLFTLNTHKCGGIIIQQLKIHGVIKEDTIKFLLYIKFATTDYSQYLLIE